MTRNTSERLPRLLNLVPYLLARPGIPVAEAAADLGISPRQLRRDLELLWMCGLPGYGPGDLVDLSFAADDTVTVTHDAGLRRPLRPTTAEATALLVALRTLADVPGVVDTDAVRRAIAKLEHAVGEAGLLRTALAPALATAPPAAPPAVAPVAPPAAPPVVPADPVAGQERVVTAVRDALAAGRALRIDYYTAGRDAVGRRDIDPVQVLVVDGRGYLEAWCRRAEAVRMFRLDRVEAVEVLDEPAAPPAHVEPTDPGDGVFRAAPDDRTAVLDLHPAARWVADYYPVEDTQELDAPQTDIPRPDTAPPDDHAAPDTAPTKTAQRDTGSPGAVLRVRLRFADTGWLVRLVLGLGGDAVLREPADLVAEVGARARAALS